MLGVGGQCSAAFQSGSPDDSFLAKREAKLSSQVPVDLQTHQEVGNAGCPTSSEYGRKMCPWLPNIRYLALSLATKNVSLAAHW